MLYKQGICAFTGLLWLFSGLISTPVSAIDVAIPPDFYTYTIDVNNNPADGYFYMDPHDDNPITRVQGIWLAIMSNDGNIKFFYKGYRPIIPFPNVNKFSMRLAGERVGIMDMTYSFIDTLVPANGYRTDGHDFLISGSGEEVSYWMLLRDHREINMSEIVEDGDPDAVVWGSGLQKFDADKVLVWEWLSLDHTDEIPIINMFNRAYLTSDNVDYIHSNSFWVDDEAEYVLLSNRYQNEIVKIKIGADDRYADGEVIWRLGGGRGNQFTFINDVEGEEAFLAQHNVTRLENGNILLFDNGMNNPNHPTRIKEYTLDEEVLTATLVWNYLQDPPSRSRFGGGTYREEASGHTMIGWGGDRTTEIFATEVDPDGEIAWEITMQTQSGETQPMTYRLYKTDMIGIAASPYVVSILDSQALTLTCNWFGHEDEVASYNVYMDDTFEPTVLHDNTDTGTMVIEDLAPGVAQFLRIKAVDYDNNEISDYSNEIEITPDQGIYEEQSLVRPQEYILEQNYPNPFNPITFLNIHLPQTSRIKVLVYDTLGRQVAPLYNGVMTAGIQQLQFDGTGLASGNYFVKMVIPGKFEQVKKIVLMK
ncbi:MAG: aryl-sulfate sulfotransferase [Candidatus Electryonea clarkiae]|nr:aryl-sulfate sulfotransferase [Candidatus Electryonea clarkiae]MDP8288673.1 aryl-sulfate sulfotransferase [Candidatus Electryonea clarkiae]